MDRFFLVFVGGGLGAVARYGVGLAVGRAGLTGWPYATLSVNLVGGLLMGVLAGVLAHRGGEGAEQWRAALGVGVLGGFTTFSAFSLETALMVERRELVSAGSYALASVVLCVLAVFAGLMLARRVFA
jgi:CrcB protein